MFEMKLLNSNSSTLAFAFILLMGICAPHFVICQEFGYDGKMGPAHWNEQYNTCGGKFQSPININILEVIDREYLPIKMNGFDVAPLKAEVQNNGHTVEAKFIYKDGQTPTIHGGPLGSKGIYRFSQFHFHWGDNDTFGSEDRINNVSFPAELHMVFYNVKYDSFKEAVKHSEGVAVMAFFYTIQKKENFNYAEFCYLLSQVREPNQTVTFEDTSPTLKHLITDDIESYFTYTGSLTTPPCSEDVTWIDFEKPIKISAEQISPFRHLHTANGIPLTHNFRPVQPLNNRTVFKSIPMPSTAFNYDNYNSSATDIIVFKTIYFLITCLCLKLFLL